MLRDANEDSGVLEYRGTEPRTTPQRWWLFAAFMLAIVMLENVFGVRLTPPGWPTDYDYWVMLLLPIGAIVMAAGSTLPGWAIGLYGGFGACTFLVGQFGDNNFRWRLSSEGAIRTAAIHWIVFVIASWGICRAMVLIRWRPSRETAPE